MVAGNGRRNMNSDNGLVDGSGIYLMAFAGVHLLEAGGKAWYS